MIVIASIILYFFHVFLIHMWYILKIKN